jgi:hypothetical protein
MEISTAQKKPAGISRRTAAKLTVFYWSEPGWQYQSIVGGYVLV